MNRYSSRKDNSYIKWILLTLGIIGILFFMKGFLGSENTNNDVFAFTVGGSGDIVITNNQGERREVAGTTDSFSPSDSLLSVRSGVAELSQDDLNIWVDRSSDVTYKSATNSGIIFEIIQGRVWIESKGNSVIKLKHLQAEITSDDIILVEQQRIHSIIYSLRGNPKISSSGGRTISLPAGSRIMASQSDLVNIGTDLKDLSGKIDESIKQNAFFLARNGQGYLDLLNVPDVPVSNSGSIPSSSMSGIQTSIGATTGRYIQISSPQDGALIKGSSIRVDGKILSKEVTKIMINEKTLTPKAGSDTFNITLPFDSDTFDIVYKAYNVGGNLLERGVITLYSEERKEGTDKLIPTTFPTSDTTFKIVSPTENPYKTTASAVTVSGTLPKGMVEYITVNNFRLKKFPQYGTSWYYYANTAYDTMKEGFNLYEIKFYGADDTLLSTQLFTIIKEGSSSTLSGE